ncbi:MAG: hypothetical protein DRJ60_06540 [Thermoprotei archaeon]|nr:MAG: hypothetical protein DRJ60_06540 [Thermoprotei archaeon]
MYGRYFTKAQKAAVYGVTAASAIAIFYLPFYMKLYTPSPPYFIPTDQLVNTIFCIGILVICLVIGIAEDLDHNWRRRVEMRVSSLIRDLIDYMRAGTPFTLALKECAKKDYGPLSKELSRAVGKMLLGLDLETSISDIARRVKTPLMEKVATLLIEVNRSGAKALDILQSYLALHSTLESYEAEKNSELKPYMWVMYISFGVYLLVVYILITQFMMPLTATQGVTELIKGTIDINFYKAVFFYCGVIEAIAAGLAIGKISKGASITGLKHSVVMLIALLILFTQLL